MGNSEVARVMLRKAHDDLVALGGMLDQQIFSNDIFGFHCQQAVEKAAKAVLLHLGAEPPFHHDLRVFLGDLEAAGSFPAGTWRDLLDLTPYAARWRYAEHDDDMGLNRLAVLGRVTAFVAVADAAVGGIAA